jgi:hypothetical protein
LSVIVQRAVGVGVAGVANARAGVDVADEEWLAILSIVAIDAAVVSLGVIGARGYAHAVHARIGDGTFLVLSACALKAQCCA